LVKNHPLEAEVATFADFLAFLSGMLVGAEKPDATVVAAWAETYRRLSTESLTSEIASPGRGHGRMACCTLSG